MYQRSNIIKKMGSHQSSQHKNRNKTQSLINKSSEKNNSAKKLDYTPIHNSGWHPGIVNKSPNDPDYNWHRHTPQGRKALSEMSDSFYMD